MYCLSVHISNSCFFQLTFTFLFGFAAESITSLSFSISVFPLHSHVQILTFSVPPRKKMCKRVSMCVNVREWVCVKTIPSACTALRLDMGENRCNSRQKQLHTHTHTHTNRHPHTHTQTHTQCECEFPPSKRQCTNLLEPLLLLPSHPRGSVTLASLRSGSSRHSVARSFYLRSQHEKFWNGELVLELELVSSSSVAIKYIKLDFYVSLCRWHCYRAQGRVSIFFSLFPSVVAFVFLQSVCSRY